MQIPALCLLDKNSVDPFPCIADLYQIFMKKGIRTVFFTLGAGRSCIPELEIAEMIGCPVNIICENESEATAWGEVKECLKTHKMLNGGFSEGAEKKWVLTKNVRIVSPEWKSGNILSKVKEACKSMSISEDNTRIDILKIDMKAGRLALYEILDAGFRPAVLIIRWENDPNLHPGVRLAAGNLQNCGYVLLKKEGQKYLYFFVDNDMYATCSWEIEGSVNPMVDNLVQQVLSEISTPPPSANRKVDNNIIDTIVDAC